MRKLCTILALGSVIAVGCGRDEEETNNAGGETAPGPAPVATAPAKPRGPVTISRSDAVSAAASIRELAGRETALNYLDAWIDPSQSGASGLIGPSLMQFARHAILVEVAREKFGDAGADAAARLNDSFSVDLGNGLTEMFEADHFEEVRRDGGRAYVMANLADGQPIGDPIVFKDNQGDWLLLLADGDEPWSEARIGLLMSAIGGALGRADQRAAAIDRIIADVREGRIENVKQLEDAIAQLNAPTAG